jgi:hypothetical protein
MTIGLVGCSKKMPNDAEMKEAMNSYIFNQTPFKASSLKDLDCDFEGYAFADVKEMPKYKCTANVALTNGQSGPVRMAASRRMNGELMVDYVY